MAITTIDHALIYELKSNVIYSFLMLVTLLILAFLQVVTTWPILDKLAIFTFIFLAIYSFGEDLGKVYAPSIGDIAALGGISPRPGLHIHAIRAVANVCMMYISSFLFDQTCSYDGKKPSSFILDTIRDADDKAGISKFSDIKCSFGIFGMIFAIMLGAFFIISVLRTLVTMTELIFELIGRLTEWLD